MFLTRDKIYIEATTDFRSRVCTCVEKIVKSCDVVQSIQENGNSLCLGAEFVVPKLCAKAPQSATQSTHRSYFMGYSLFLRKTVIFDLSDTQ